ncbi:hypothetical protein DW1_2008 [Proteiniborus sp. DW1]|uniref:CoA-binding protein n=1 Tax=Proteiniborus sp. DW1 TaxID=1889883 RepID=UPI00092E0B96|nr:CoA-binding protein [Proteiniborus sp. DW1]SCG83575.1 hypothetical protein DW1_2008 [Proteiniborus sp. DW1]
MEKIETLKKKMLEKKVWAVIGATAKKEKFGYKVWKKLEESGYETYPINPSYDEIDGKKCYNSLMELPKKPDVINFIIPPESIFNILPIAKELEIEYLWCQPGAVNQELVSEAERLGFKIAYNVCVLVELGE